MNYYSLNDSNKISKTGFKEAVINGIAPDKGLYFPSEIKPLDADFIKNIDQYSNEEIAYQVIHQFVNGAIPDTILKEIIADTLSFDFPVIPLEKDIYSLELFHGPTMAFKDVGARFMARCLGYFNQNKKKQVTVLVATSGDTGGAVANGFLGVKGVNVVILYPSGKVSDIQEKQLTTLGKNITALEVDGVFDDCQDMVKTAFLDKSLSSIQLTSANSINIARWLPQMFYFFFAFKQLKSHNKSLVFSVPSGNFGNICAGIMAYRLGLPVTKFVAATNSNNVIPQYMASQKYEIKASIQTISNAMDVGNPSNFIRIQELFNNDFEALQKKFSSFSFTDEQTKETMQMIYHTTDYITDPHGAVGYLGLKRQLEQSNEGNTIGVFLETAHPVKFLPVIEKVLTITPTIPQQIQIVMNKSKKSIFINTYSDLHNFLKNNITHL